MLRYRLTHLLAALPFCVLTLLIRRLPVWVDDDGWSLWLDAHYLRYCRLEPALWGWCSAK